MSFLARIQRDRTPKPPRLLVFGTEGIGKSTFAALAPAGRGFNRLFVDFLRREFGGDSVLAERGETKEVRP